MVRQGLGEVHHKATHYNVGHLNGGRRAAMRWKNLVPNRLVLGVIVVDQDVVDAHPANDISSERHDPLDPHPGLGLAWEGILVERRPLWDVHRIFQRVGDKAKEAADDEVDGISP